MPLRPPPGAESDPKRLGPYKFKEPSMDLNLTEELSESLRSIKVGFDVAGVSDCRKIVGSRGFFCRTNSRKETCSRTGLSDCSAGTSSNPVSGSFGPGNTSKSSTRNQATASWPRERPHRNIRFSLSFCCVATIQLWKIIPEKFFARLFNCIYISEERPRQSRSLALHFEQKKKRWRCRFCSARREKGVSSPHNNSNFRAFISPSSSGLSRFR